MSQALGDPYLPWVILIFPVSSRSSTSSDITQLTIKHGNEALIPKFFPFFFACTQDRNCCSSCDFVETFALNPFGRARGVLVTLFLQEFLLSGEGFVIPKILIPWNCTKAWREP